VPTPDVAPARAPATTSATTSTAASATPPATLATLRRGFGVLGVAVREQPRLFTVAVLGSAVFAATTVAQAYVIGAVTQRVVVPAIRSRHATTASLVITALAVMAVATVKVGGIIVRRLSALSMQYRLQADYRRRIATHYLRLPMTWHLSRSTGELLAHATSDVEATWFAIGALPLAVGVIVMLVITLAALFLTDLALAAVGVVVLPATATITIVYARRMTPLVARVQQLRGRVSGVAHESFDGALVVKTLGREADEQQRFTVPTLALRDALVRVGRTRGTFEPMLDAIPSLGVLLILFVGSQRVAHGSIASGQLVRSAYLFTLLAFPLRALGWVLNELPRSVAGWDRMRRVLDEPLPAAATAPAYPQPPAPVGAAVSVAGVCYSYADGPPVLTDVDLDVEAGETLALVGPTGAGKSTLANLLVRLVPPAAGTIRVDGASLEQMPSGLVTREVALVPQQTFLFDDTVRDNVDVDGTRSDEEVWNALRLAQADGFVAALPRGLATQLGERGARLSGGQRQRLAIARALVRRPRLLILDDATSSLDPRVEARILAGLRDRNVGDVQRATTIVLVAHRLATIGLADRVAYLDGGKLRALGTHSSLLAERPDYRRLVFAYDETEAVEAAYDPPDTPAGTWPPEEVPA
jgi:ABC-type multidrug transport system fused ATPase/permease subunit